MRRVRRDLDPVVAWIAERRDDASAVAAWRAASTFPLVRMREAWLDPVIAAVSYAGIVLWVGYAVWELDLAAWTAIPLFAGVFPFLLSVNVVRFFGFERVLRPILRDIGRNSFAGEEVELSLLFMDIRGFTSYSERAEAHEVVARLNDLYGAVVPVVLRHGGHANKFIGDGLLAVFGAPDRLPDHADRAVAVVLEVAELVRDRYDGELRVGIGVNSGKVVLGTIGGGGRLDFTVIGDAVNTAARVESATRQTDDDILITDATRRAMTDPAGRWEDRPPMTLKGKSEPVRLFAPIRAIA